MCNVIYQCRCCRCKHAHGGAACSTATANTKAARSPSGTSSSAGDVLRGRSRARVHGCMPRAVCVWIVALAMLSSPPSTLGFGRYVVHRFTNHLRLSADEVYSRLLAAHPDPPNATVVEVGVFDGAQCAAAANARFGRVVCFEPSPTNHARAAATLAASRKQDWGKVELVQKAAAARSNDTVEFHALGGTEDHAGPLIPDEDPAFRSTAAAGGGAGGINVSTIALDDAFPAPNHLFLVKVDTQGFDGLVLRGMERLLRERRVDYVMAEVWPRSMERALGCEATLRMVADWGYAIHVLAMHVRPDEAPTLKEWYKHGSTIRAFCDFYLSHSKTFGLFTDVVLAPAVPHADSARRGLRAVLD